MCAVSVCTKSDVRDAHHVYQMPMIGTALKMKAHDWLVPVRMETQAELVGKTPEYNIKQNLMCLLNSVK